MVHRTVAAHAAGYPGEPELFRTGWFVKSVLSASLVVFVLRTRLPFTHSHRSRGMLIMTTIVILITLAVPFSLVAGLLGFKALPLQYLLAIAIVVLAYLGLAEVTKQLLYQRVRLQ